MIGCAKSRDLLAYPLSVEPELRPGERNQSAHGFDADAGVLLRDNADHGEFTIGF